MLAPRAELDRWVSAFAPDIEHVDHRTVGFGGVLGAHEFRAALATLFELSDDVATRIEDIHELRSDALLLRWTNFGTQRVGGGAYERPFLWLAISGAAGLLTRIELFDPERDAEALARFDELTSGTLPVHPAHRRVRANAATASAARIDAAFAARDGNALAGLLTDGVDVIDHTSVGALERRHLLGMWRALLRVDDLTYRLEPLGTLGESLALCRGSVSASAVARGKFDVGAYDNEFIVMMEVDTQARLARFEVFAADHLGDAVARLYQRYADLLPDGPARARAAATARSVAALLGPLEPDRWAAAIAPDVECMDHRPLGLPPLQGAGAFLGGLRSLLDLVEDTVARVDDVLALRSDALLVRWTNLGTARAGGGAYERNLVALRRFGGDGLLTRYELFDPERVDEALARFEELSEPRSGNVSKRVVGRRVPPNAATANAARLGAAIATRDADAIADQFADDARGLDNPAGVTVDRRGLIFGYRTLLRAEDPMQRHEPLATLGHSLALYRLSTSASGFAGGKLDVGAYEREDIVLIEVDAEGRRRWEESFARLGDAIARLYERYADLLPDGPARARAAATARSVATMLRPLDPDRYATAYAPAVESVDHRILGTWFARGAEALLQHHHTLLGLADDVAIRNDDVLGLRFDALLLVRKHLGTARAGGGVYERPFLWLGVFGTDGLLTRNEIFDADRDADALARFDELTAEPAALRFAPGPSRAPVKRAPRVRPNAATAHATRFDAAIVAREDGAFPTALFADESEFVDHPLGTTYDRQGSLATWRSMRKVRDLTCRHEPLATRGDSLALCRLSTSASGFAGGTFDVGPYQRGGFILIEVDAQGRRRRAQAFATARLGDAVARLYERYADLLPDGPARTRAAATARSIAVVVGPVDVDRYATAFAPAVESVDHRILGTWSARGAEALLQHYRSVLELADDVAIREDEVLGLRSNALLLRRTHSGTARAGGGAYERQYLALSGFGADGLVRLNELFDCDREAEALARFDELVGEPPAPRSAPAPSHTAERRVRPNAATANAARIDAVIAGRDPDTLPTLFAEAVEFVEHTTGVVYDREGVLRSLRSLLGARDPALRHEPLAALGDALALCRVSWSASGLASGRFDVGAYETERIDVIEVDTQGAAGGTRPSPPPGWATPSSGCTSVTPGFSPKVPRTPVPRRPRARSRRTWDHSTSIVSLRRWHPPWSCSTIGPPSGSGPCMESRHAATRSARSSRPPTIWPTGPTRSSTCARARSSSA
jgi:hypothetical protein